MFEWKVEDMTLLNQKSGLFLRKKIYDCEYNTTREDKISFVDSKQDGILSYLLTLIEKFNQDVETMPKDQYGNVKTISLKAWIKKNDTKYSKPIIDDHYEYGKYYILGMERYITNNEQGHFDIYKDLVDELFHRQLKKCEEKERDYFLEHDERSILKREFRTMMDKYDTTFGVPVVIHGNNYYIGDFKKNREITLDEIKEMLSKYEQLDSLVKKIAAETHIVYDNESYSADYDREEDL